jgi:hypothetical protein
VEIRETFGKRCAARRAERAVCEMEHATTVPLHEAEARGTRARIDSQDANAAPPAFAQPRFGRSYASRAISSSEMSKLA